MSWESHAPGAASTAPPHSTVPEQDSHDAASLRFGRAADREVVAAVAIHVSQRGRDSSVTACELSAVLARVDHGQSALLGVLDVACRAHPDVVDSIAVVVARGA